MKNPKAALSIDTFLSDVKNLFSDKGERFINVLLEFLHEGLKVKQHTESKIDRFYSYIYENFLKGTNNPAAAEFNKLFVDVNTRELNYIDQIQILKNIKDYLVIQKGLKS